MFCSTCFQKAEEGSKFCADCRRVREAQGETLVPVPLPQAVAWTPPSLPASAPMPGPLEEVEWTPPPPSERTLPSYADLAESVELPLAEIPVLKSLEPVPDLATLVSAPLENVPAMPAPLPPAAEPPLPRAHYVPPPQPVEEKPIHNPFGEAPVVTITDPSPAGAPVLPEPSSAVERTLEPDEIRISIQPMRRRGSTEISAMLLVGILLLSVTAVGQVFKDSATPPVSAQASASPANKSTAQLFLDSAEKSMQARDYELAASQLKKAVEEMTNGGAPEVELARTRLLYARALLGNGKLEQALAECQGMPSDALRKEADSLAAGLRKGLREKAQGLLASGRQDLKNGDLSAAGEKGREAAKIFAKHGGSPEQVASAETLLTAARRAEANLGLKRKPEAVRTTRLPRLVGQDGGRPQTMPGYPDIPARRVSVRRPGGAAYPQGRPRVNSNLPAEIPVIPHIPHRRRGAPAAVRSGPESLPPEMPQPPDQGQPPPAEPAPPVYRSGSTSSKARAGDADVLPTYNAKGGGSVY